jgi:hypothetical protein
MTGPTQPPSGPESTPAQQPGQGWQPAPGQAAAMGPETTRLARLDPGPSLGFGVVGALIAAVGAVTVIVAFSALDWFTKNSITRGSNAHTHFSDIHQLLNVADTIAAGTAKVYFAWLGWALLVVVAAFALLANLPSPLTNAFRIVGAIAAAAAIAVTFAAIKLVDTSASAADYSDFLKHASIGFYAAVAGFLLIGVGAVVGPTHRSA